MNDPQYGGSVAIGHYADLQRLFDLSHCTSCMSMFTQRAQLIDQIQAMGPVPADIPPGDPRPFTVGPITDLEVVGRLLELRASFAVAPTSQQVDF